MADQNETNGKTQANLAYYWSFVASLILGYIVYKWGDQKEILTLIIGLIGGTVLGGIFGIYFGGSLTKKTDPPVVTNSGDSPVTNVVQSPIPNDTPTQA